MRSASLPYRPARFPASATAFATTTLKTTGRFHQRGLTLLELIVTLALIAIVTTQVVPGFQNLLARQQVAGESLRIATALSTARSTAITRGTTVTLCPSRDRQNCLADWSAPLLIIQGRADAKQIDGDDEILQVLEEGRIASVGFRNNYSAIRIPASGWPRGYNGTFYICGNHGVSAGLIMNATGRLRSGDAVCD
ncbi:GspH/FimT family pseudopilin [Pistricoccus aurantiacus]|uniref:GspH/FimT family pseudopilin n=1 Tax=Pistricoccus aurantiacus TaxID=1883414 RepID=UPI0036302985